MTDRRDLRSPRRPATEAEMERFERELVRILVDEAERRAKMSPVGAPKGGRAA